jgi:hypothetical protein
MDEVQRQINENDKDIASKKLYISDQQRSIRNIIGKYLNTSDVFSNLTDDI